LDDVRKHLANVIGGLVVAVLFEWLRSRRTAPTVRLPEGAPADIVRGADPWARAREFLRIVLSLVIGFVLSAVIAGFLHGASKHQIDIRSGEPAMFVLVGFSTAFAWFALAAFSRR
jgi:hypothetical protein